MDSSTLHQLREIIENEESPYWLNDKINIEEKSALASNGSGGAKVSLKSQEIESLPAFLKHPVEDIERQKFDFQESVDALEVNPKTRDGHLTITGTIKSDGKMMSNPSVILVYQSGVDTVLNRYSKTHSEGNKVEENLELSHNDVVLNMSENVKYISEIDMRSSRTAASESKLLGNPSFIEYIFDGYIEGHILDGHFENSAPPFDYNFIVENDYEKGRFMYYCYRWHGWGFEEERIQDIINQLNNKYSDGGYVVL